MLILVLEILYDLKKPLGHAMHLDEIDSLLTTHIYIIHTLGNYILKVFNFSIFGCFYHIW